MTVLRLTLDQVADRLGPSISTAVFRSSFETRCLAVAQHTKQVRVDHVFLLNSVRASERAIQHKRELEGRFADEPLTQIALDRNDPVKTASELLDLAAAVRDANGSTIIDVATIRREELLVLTCFLGKDLSVEQKKITYIVYTEPSEFSGDWPSSDYRDVRSVVGYSGQPDSGKRTHAVILMGFETERASYMIHAYEPSDISV